MAMDDRAKPLQSKRPGSGVRICGTKRMTAAMPSTPTGTLSQKIHGQSATDSTKPASGGPISGPTRAGMVNQPMALSSFSLGLEPTTMRRATGVIIAPPMPWRIRKTTSCSSELEKPQSTEPARKTVMATRNTRRAPNRSAAQPLTGTNTARARM